MKLKRREYFGIQRKMVSHMTTESWTKIPHVTYMYEPDVTDFFEEYKVKRRKRLVDKIDDLSMMITLAKELM